MKRKKLLLVFAVLTAFAARSQDTTDLRPVSFPFWMAKEIALDLVEKDRLEKQVLLLSLEVSSYRILASGLEKIGKKQTDQLGLLEKSMLSFEKQLKAEKAKKPRERTFTWMLRMLGAFGVGWVLSNR